MSTYKFSIKSRRSSLFSKHSFKNENINYNVNNFKKSDWFNTFLYFKNNQNLSFDEDVCINILKLFFDDKISDNVIIHLLTVLECNYIAFEDINLLEQAIGSLLNIYSTLNHSKQVKKKILYTITTLLIATTINNNSQINPTFNILIELLIENLKLNFLTNESSECLNQIELIYPGKINEICKNQHIPNKSLVLLTSQIINKQFNQEDINEISEYLLNEKTNPLVIFRVLIIFFEFMKNNLNENLLSTNFFKSFLNDLIFSSELCFFHLALQLLLNFDLTFTFYGEQDLLNQLFILCIHPSLTTTHRLIILNFVEVLMQFPKFKNYFNSKKFEIYDVLNSPNIQEKKLQILLQSDIKDEDLLFSLKPLKNLCLIKKNKRASDSLYRILNTIIKIRPSMNNKIEYLVLSLILNCPSQHISRAISLLNYNPGLTQNFSNLIIEETNNYFNDFQDKNDLKQYFLAFEWILNQINLDQKNIIIILNFVKIKCDNRPNFYQELLNCCSAIIRKQCLTKQIKSVIEDALTYLSLKCKKNLELSSWTQIYLIAINTLINQENFKKVFDGIELLKNNNFTYTFNKNDFPLKIERNKQRISKKIYFIDLNDLNDLNNLKYDYQLGFTISIEDKYSKLYQNFYCIEFIISNEDQSIKLKKTITFLDHKSKEKIFFNLKLIKVIDFGIKIALRFTDINGIIYTYYNLFEHITFRETFQPLSLTYIQFEKIWRIFLNIDNEKIIKNLIPFPKYKSYKEFLQYFTWLQNFTIKGNRISFLVPSSNIVLIKIIEINDMVNLRVITNNLDVLYRLKQEFID